MPIPLVFMPSLNSLSWSVGCTTLVMSKILQSWWDHRLYHKKTVNSILLACLLLALLFACSGGNNCSVVNCPMERNHDRPLATASKELGPWVQQPMKKWILSSTTCVNLEAGPPSFLPYDDFSPTNTLTAILWEPEDPDKLYPYPSPTKIVRKQMLF